MMQAQGISLDIIDRCQNHVIAGSKVRRHYLHHDYEQEKREAWHKLGLKLTHILAEQQEQPTSLVLSVASHNHEISLITLG